MDSFLLPSELAVVKQQLVYVSSKLKTNEILHCLQSNNVLSLPVWEEEEKRWIGIIDMLDIISAHGMLDWSSTTLDLRDSFDKFKNSTITAGQIVSRSPRNQHLIIVCHGESLLNSMQHLTESHRILISGSESNSPSSFYLLCQMDIVRQLAKTDLGVYGARKIEELFPPKNILSVREDDLARDAFQLMYEKKLGALAVVDKNDVLITTLSSSDLKTIGADTIGNILLPVNKFLTMSHGSKPPVPIVAKPADHLELILAKILIAKIHRVWVTNSAEQPTGVITLTDILKLLTSAPPVSM